MIWISWVLCHINPFREQYAKLLYLDINLYLISIYLLSEFNVENFADVSHLIWFSWVCVWHNDQAETLLHNLERAAASIGLYVNAHKTEYMCYNQTGDIRRNPS